MRFVECHYYWDSIPPSINTRQQVVTDIIRISFGINGQLVLQV